jgi:hypothetical protein
MATKKKLLQAAAGVGGAGLDVDEVFSTYLYTGTGAQQTINNGLDLLNEGGVVWLKARDNSNNNDHSLFDSETSTGSTFPVVQKAWESNVAGSLAVRQPGFTFTSTGFTTTSTGRSDSNGTDESGIDYVTWSFRRASKFFDVVNYTGDGNTSKTISHNLGAVPAMMIVLGESAGDFWVYHKDVGNTKYLELNKTTAAQTSSSAWNNTTPTATEFTVGNGTPVNYSGVQYTVYLFAHNDGDGDFGPTADQDIIKCGSYTGNGSGQDINLGFEAQWVMIKPTSTTGNWTIMDVMRGMPTSGIEGRRLQANTANVEGTANYLYGMKALETGFTIDGLTANDYNKSGETYIYMAIRRGPLAEPESATDVFAIDQGDTTSTDPQFISNFPVDMGIYRYVAGAAEHNIGSRITGATYGQTQNTNAFSGDGDFTWDYMNGWYASTRNTSHYSWMWKRAPGYFDVVAYTGNGTSGNTISHNLGVVPEMMWVKRRDGGTNSWLVYNKDVGNTAGLLLNGTNASITGTIYWNDTTPTDSVFSLGTSTSVNGSSMTYIAYLFASLDGVSKVGSYTGNGETAPINIDCGFSSGARFVLIKRTDSSGDWYIYDSERGIVAGGDPYLLLNSTAAEVTGTDYIDPYSSGFTISDASTGTTLSVSGATYIFYAIA